MWRNLQFSINHSTNITSRFALSHRPSTINQFAKSAVSAKQLHNRANRQPAENTIVKPINQSLVHRVSSTSASSGSIRRFSQSTTKPTSYFPYGVANFSRIRKDGEFFVDRTSFIPKFEFGNRHALFLRRPRFGKSLFVNMLSCYYDHSTTKEEFDELFGDLDIVKDPSNWSNTSSFTASSSNPTPGCREYYVLMFNLLIPFAGDSQMTTQLLHDHINGAISDFCVRYKVTGEVSNQSLYIHNSFARLQALADALVTQHRSGQLKKPPRLMILVDEYDSYVNKVILDDPQQYLASLEDKVKSASVISPLRSFLETLKSITLTKELEYRSVLVGLTPLAFADASGANIWSNILNEPILSSVCGFTENDLKRGLSDIGFKGKKQSIALMVMKRCFNGYKFPASKEPLYAPQQCFFFLERLQSGSITVEKLVEINKALDKGGNVNLLDLVDDNSRVSGKVLKLLAHFPALIICSSLSKRTPYILCPSLSSTNFVKQDSMDLSLPDPARVEPTQIDYLVSFLYYHGWLTIKEQVGPMKFVFDTPNLLIKPLFLDHFSDMVLRLDQVTRFIDNPTEEGLAELLAPLYVILSDRQWADNSTSESNLFIAFTVLFASTRGSSVKTELKTERFEKDGYIDICLESHASNKAVMIEFKRIRPNSVVLVSEDGTKKHNLNGDTDYYIKLCNDLTEMHSYDLRHHHYIPGKHWIKAQQISEKQQMVDVPSVPVTNLEKEAAKQVAAYAAPSSVTAARFTVVQVAKPFLIQKIS